LELNPPRLLSVLSQKLHRMQTLIWLVVSTLRKMMEFVNGKDDIPDMKWNIKFHGLKPPTSDDLLRLMIYCPKT